jgi:hypothetical protein
MVVFLLCVAAVAHLGGLHCQIVGEWLGRGGVV